MCEHALGRAAVPALELVAPKDDPGLLVFYEVFASESGFAAHRDSPHAAWFRDARGPLRPRGQGARVPRR